MFRMANETKYCTMCHAWHPLIMFSQRQRNVAWAPPTNASSDSGSAQSDREDGAVCIMAEGGVAICPHLTVSLETMREWHEAVFRDRSMGRSWPWRCELCFQDLEEPFRSAAAQPAATYIPSRDSRPHRKVMGNAYLQWTMPLQIDAATVLGGDWKSLQDDGDATGTKSRSEHIEKLEAALAKAAETYNDLLCPHVRFDDPYTLQDFARHSAQTLKDFRNGHTWSCRLWMDGWVQMHPTGMDWLGDRIDLCKTCSAGPWNRSFGVRTVPGAQWEYQWVLSEHGGLSLQRQLDRAYEAWRRMLSPASYGLDTDTELRHVTWCPDKRCANGQG
ncbi:hypothetical protein PG993_008502 [Apiospora rasikravindrae]|uniref:Uncharacterized protein n=1 Tax=Apiospora rasikravindrae TaxID=990691 RepID=A0ABR1T0I7_9PEZI